MVASSRSRSKFLSTEDPRIYRNNKWYAKRDSDTNDNRHNTTTMATVTTSNDIGAKIHRLRLVKADPAIKHKEVSPSDVTKDTVILLCSITIISITLYLTFQLWKKHKERPILEEYRYSRLSQNELDVDNVSFSDEHNHRLQQDLGISVSDDDESIKPATLHLESESLINLTNASPANGPVKSTFAKSEYSTLISALDENSDEELLQ